MTAGFPRPRVVVSKCPGFAACRYNGLGHFREGLSAQEKAHSLDALAEYRAGRLPMSVPVAIMRAWVVRFGEPYLGRQHFFAPYPADLSTTTDSGKGRDPD